MQKVIVCVVTACCLASCNEIEQENALEIPASCTGNVARLAAAKVTTPILKEIADPQTRDAGCLKLDGVLRDVSASFHYDEFKQDGCSWGYGESDPYEHVKSILAPHGPKLSNVCDWERRDAERSLQERGEQILGEFSSDDQETLKRAFEGQ